MIAVVEVPQNSVYKYEIDKETGVLRLDRTLPVRCPYSYGFIKDTLAPDGDALDVFILSQEPIPPLTEVEIEVAGMLFCMDNGVVDHKVVAFIKDESFKNLDILLNSVIAYLQTYKAGFVTNGGVDAEEALKYIEECKI
jgi:inorganic pyrophosphatase